MICKLKNQPARKKLWPGKPDFMRLPENLKKNFKKGVDSDNGPMI